MPKVGGWQRRLWAKQHAAVPLLSGDGLRFGVTFEWPTREQEIIMS